MPIIFGILSQTVAVVITMFCGLSIESAELPEELIGHYLRQNVIQEHMSFSFYQNYGRFRGKSTQIEAAVDAWAVCDQQFDQHIGRTLEILENWVGQELGPEQRDLLIAHFNPGRGVVRDPGVGVVTHLAPLGPAHLVTLNLRTTCDRQISSEWTCYRYVARMEAELNMSLWRFLG